MKRLRFSQLTCTKQYGLCILPEVKVKVRAGLLSTLGAFKLPGRALLPTIAVHFYSIAPSDGHYEVVKRSKLQKNMTSFL